MFFWYTEVATYIFGLGNTTLGVILSSYISVKKCITNSIVAVIRSRRNFVSENDPKSVIVPKDIDTVHVLIQQDRHVSYREIEAFLRISYTKIHSISHEHWDVTIAQKKKGW